MRLAIKAGVPIVPISTVGGPDSMPVLATGSGSRRRSSSTRSRASRCSRSRCRVPWGISPALLPEIPLPTKIRTAFQDPVELTDDPERYKDDDYVEEKYEEVRESIQHGMDALARRRRFPVFG